MIDETNIEWGYDYAGRPYLLCCVEDVEIGVIAEFGAVNNPYEKYKEYYVYSQSILMFERPWKMEYHHTVPRVDTALAMFHGFIAQAEMKSMQQEDSK